MAGGDGRRAAVMIVDDMPANLGLLEGMLHAHGYAVAAFRGGGMALRAAALAPPDLILLDIMMPGMDGYEVCRRLKGDERLRDIPVIFISVLGDTGSKVEAFTRGGADYVTKPFQQEEVLARVRTHLRLRRQQVEIERQRQQIQHSLDGLRALEAQHDQLVHMVAHDMRSPLTGILGNLEILDSILEETGNGEAMDIAGQIGEAGRSLREMITALLDISRMEANRMPLYPEACDLRGVASDAIGSLGSLVRECEFRYEPPGDAVTGLCDREITRRVIENLLANAIKFTGMGGEVRLELHAAGSGVEISVRDNGPGIPPEFRGRIFEKFGQVAARQAGRKFSTGLGLTFCKLAVEAQGGSIGLECGTGTGSRFWFTVPAA